MLISKAPGDIRKHCFSPFFLLSAAQFRLAYHNRDAVRYDSGRLILGRVVLFQSQMTLHHTMASHVPK